jgi:hypothetical protein
VPGTSVGPPWLNCVKTASEAGLEEWIGRCNIICDAGVTRRLIWTPRGYRKLGLVFRAPSASWRELTLVVYVKVSRDSQLGPDTPRYALVRRT